MVYLMCENHCTYESLKSAGLLSGRVPARGQFIQDWFDSVFESAFSTTRSGPRRHAEKKSEHNEQSPGQQESQAPPKRDGVDRHRLGMCWRQRYTLRQRERTCKSACKRGGSCSRARAFSNALAGCFVCDHMPYFDAREHLCVRAARVYVSVSDGIMWGFGGFPRLSASTSAAPVLNNRACL